MTVQAAHREPWPPWATMLVALLTILVLATALPWLVMGFAMTSGCFGMMNGLQMPMPGTMPMR